MRILNGVLLVILILFAGVQYNDPDGMFWATVYGVGAFWCAVAAFRTNVFLSNIIFALYGLCFAGCVFGVAWFWPKTPHWWSQDVWWETETAREGMGMMILTICVIAAGITALRIRKQ